jgi:hypothetical protein
MSVIQIKLIALELKMSPETVKNQAESVVKRVYEAVKHLCTGRGDVRSRLKVSGVDLIFLRAEDFPEHLRDDFNWIIKQLTKYKSEIPKYEGNIDATMRRIKNSTGQKIAERIFKLYSEIQDIREFPLL